MINSISPYLKKKCMDCKTLVQDQTLRCRNCFVKSITGTGPKNKCMDCSKPIQNHNKRCADCYHKSMVKAVCINGHGRAGNVSTAGHCLKCNRPKRALKVNGRQFVAYGVKNVDGSDFTALDYDRIYQVQQGKCKICDRHQTELNVRLHVDHDHKTNVFRGLLCVNCNIGIGNAKENVFILKAMIKYLEESLP